MRALRRPLNDLNALPPLPAVPRADDEAALQNALTVARHVRETVAEHQQAPELFARYLFGIRNAMTRIVDIVDAADNRMVEFEPSPHGLTRIPSIYPLPEGPRFGLTEPPERPDTSALGRMDPFYLP